VRGHFGEKVFQTIIPRTVRLGEAPSFGKPITVYDTHSHAATAYRALTAELLALPWPGQPGGTAGPSTESAAAEIESPAPTSS